MPAKKKPETFRQCIDRLGPHVIAKAVKVVPSAVWHWRRYRNLPHYSKLQKIVELSGGTLTVDSVHKDFFSPTNTRRRRTY